MSDASVHAALRSDAQLVVIEAPAGCGKTTKGASYAREIAARSASSRQLILTHTHAACSVFADHAKGAGHRIEIHTIDGVISHIASAYHAGLGLPSDIGAWTRQRKDGYGELALKVAELLKRYPMIAASLAQRYPVVICDEHQDSSSDQHAIVMALHTQGARLRIFGDPMQRIFGEGSRLSDRTSCDWDALARQAQSSENLDTPHRWSNSSPDLGRWILKARTELKAGRPIGLSRGLPPTVTIAFAENQSQKSLEYQLSSQDRKPIDMFERRPNLTANTHPT